MHSPEGLCFVVGSIQTGAILRRSDRGRPLAHCVSYPAGAVVVLNGVQPFRSSVVGFGAFVVHLVAGVGGHRPRLLWGCTESPPCLMVSRVFPSGRGVAP